MKPRSWKQIKRAAVDAAALATIADRSLPPTVRADARQDLVHAGTRPFAGADVSKLATDELLTLAALLRKSLGVPSGGLELRVIGERPAFCSACSARAGRHYVDISPYDARTRAAILAAIADAPPELREEFERDDEEPDHDQEADASGGPLEALDGAALDHALPAGERGAVADQEAAEVARAVDRVDERGLADLGGDDRGGPG